MTLSDRFEPRLMDREIITRSDHAPTDYERYGDWARKFFGYGYHQEYKDGDNALDHAAGLVAAMPTRH